MTEVIFASAIAKLERGRDHLDVLAEAVDAWRAAGDHHGVVTESNMDQASDRMIRIDWFLEGVEPFPDVWPLLVGDALQNYRAALDHAVWELATRRGEPEVGHERWIRFPVYRDGDEELFKQRAGVLTRYLTTDELATLFRLQPFSDTEWDDVVESHPLWVLHELSNVDKHRKVNLLRQDHAGFDVGFAVAPPGFRRIDGDGRFEDGAHLGGIEFQRPPWDIEMTVNRVLAYGESIGETSTTPTAPLGAMLELIHVCAVDAVAHLDPRT